MIKNSLIILSLICQMTLLGQQTGNKDTCKIISFTAENDGTLSWKTEKELSKRIWIIEDFRWNKWIKLGEVEGHGTPQATDYSFRIPPHSGENKTRIMQVNEFYVSKEVKWNPNSPEVIFTRQKKAKEIRFSRETMYEIYDASGKVIKKGWGISVSYANCPKGTYILNYDNSTAEFKR